MTTVEERIANFDKREREAAAAMGGLRPEQGEAEEWLAVVVERLLSAMEAVCPGCEGRRGEWADTYYRGPREYHPCIKCDGAGYLPTPLGERVSGFLSRAVNYYKPDKTPEDKR